MNSGLPALRESQAALVALTQRASELTGIPQAFIEKDIWVTELLRSVTTTAATAGATAIFKGGTSLSRAYGLIQRFSEDIDLLIDFPNEIKSNGAKDRLLKQITTAAATDLGLDESRIKTVQSTKGVKRNTRYLYPTFGNADDRITTGVLLEMGSRGGPHPRRVVSIRSIAADVAINDLGDSTNSWSEFAPVRVNVLAPERTLLEKLSLLHHLSAQYPATRDQLLKQGRHYYDIAKCLSNPDVVAALQNADTPGLVADIEQQSAAAGFPFTSRPTNGFASSPAFTDEGEFAENARAAYASAVTALVYEAEPPTFEDCLDAVAQHRNLL